MADDGNRRSRKRRKHTTVCQEPAELTEHKLSPEGRSSTAQLWDVAVLPEPDDNCVIARTVLEAGTSLQCRCADGQVQTVTTSHRVYCPLLESSILIALALPEDS